MRPLPPADPGVPDHRSATRYLVWLARRSSPSMIAAILLAILWMGCQAMVPMVIGNAIDAVLTGRDRDALMDWGLVLLSIGLIQSGTGVIRHRLAVFNWLAAAMRTIQLAVRQAGRLGSTLPRRIDAGEIVSIGTADISHIGHALDLTARGSGAVFAVIVVVSIMLTTSMPLGLIAVLGVPLLMGVVGVLIRPLHRRQQTYRDEQGKLTGLAGDLVAGLRVLRGVGGEPVVAARYRAESQTLRAAGVRVARVESLLEATQVLVPGTFLVLVTWLGARFAITGQITVGQLVAFYGYAAFLVSPLRILTEAIDKFIRGHVSSRRVVRMLGVRSDLPDPAEPAQLPTHPVDLADPMSGVVILPGLLTAIAAADPTDAVAIADRLGRYADGAGDAGPATGATLGGIPLAQFPLATVRERILVADNDARLFSGPLRCELDPRAERDPEAAAAATDAALEAAVAHDIVEGLPGGLDGEVAERGRSFSGGQQQRLRLARALIADPEVLILVEPTSAVDAHTEARIAARLGKARFGRTTVVCSTSPLVLDHADRVVYVESGRVVAEGTHRQLLAGVPRYAHTVTRGEEP